jgi:hypothetical protein
MKTLGRLLAVASLGLTAFNATASAQTLGPVIVISGDDANKDSVPRGNVNFSRIHRAIAERLRAGGFQVYDEADIVPDLPPARTARPVSELFEGVKLAQTPVDVIMVIQIYASVRPVLQSRDTFRPFISIDANYWRVRDHQFLGNYTFGRGVELPLIEGSCVSGKPPGQCLLQRVGDSAEPVATAMGDALATKLAADLRGNLNPDVPRTAPAPR